MHTNSVCEAREGAGPYQPPGNRNRGGKAEKPDSQQAERRPPVPDPDNADEGRSPRRPFPGEWRVASLVTGPEKLALAAARGSHHAAGADHYGGELRAATWQVRHLPVTAVTHRMRDALRERPGCGFSTTSRIASPEQAGS